MAKRALIIGSQTGGLTGVHGDVEVMADALVKLGFAATTAIAGDATYDGIVERLRGLVEDTKAADAVVVYYSGHGGRSPNALARDDSTLPRWLQYVLPTDIDDRSGGRFRGLLAEELSAFQRQLTAKTDNVTTILDCCHSARMSREALLVPKADNQIGAFPWPDLEQRWTGLRDGAPAAGGADSNVLAVRVVACSPDQTAFELPDFDLGDAHGALTSALIRVLTADRALSLTWLDLLAVLRPAVLDRVPQQRPEIEGPSERLLFSTSTRDETGVLPVVVQGGVAMLEDAVLFGVAEGDTYDVVAPGGDPEQPLATAVVDAIVGGRARLALDGATATDVPAGAVARPVDVALGMRPVAVVPAGDQRRESVVEALRQSTHVRVIDGDTPAGASAATGALATVSLVADGIQVLDAGGEELYANPRPPSAGNLKRLNIDLETLARATHVRELASGAGKAALPDDVDITYGRLLKAGGETALAPSGEHLFDGDRIVIHVHNGATETRYASVLDVGVSGAISIQTGSEPDGVTLAAAETYDVGRNAVGAMEGIELFWPEVPVGGARPETMVTIVSDAKVNGLPRLQQGPVKTRGGGARGPISELDRLIDDLSVGRRDGRPPAAVAPTVRYRVERFDFVLHPEKRSGEGEDDEPTFEVDERPDPSFRLVVARAAGAPARVAVRLKEVVVHSNRSFLASRVRVDTMVITIPGDTGGADPPYRGATARFDRVKDGDRLPFDDLLVYEGPVGRFLDLAVWVAKDDHADLDLAELLAQETGKDEVKGAVTVLAGLAVAAPQAALVAGSVAAVATLVRTGARLLDRVQGKSIGVYRTSLLPHQRFGAGDLGQPAGRHPAEGLIDAQDMSFAFEVVDLQ